MPNTAKGGQHAPLLPSTDTAGYTHVAHGWHDPPSHLLFEVLDSPAAGVLQQQPSPIGVYCIAFGHGWLVRWPVDSRSELVRACPKHLHILVEDHEHVSSGAPLLIEARQASFGKSFSSKSTQTKNKKLLKSARHIAKRLGLTSIVAR